MCEQKQMKIPRPLYHDTSPPCFLHPTSSSLVIMVVKKITIKYAPEPTIKRIKIKYRQPTPLDLLYELHRQSHPANYEDRYLCESPVSPSEEISAVPWTLDSDALTRQLFATLEPRLDELISRVLDGGSDRLPRWKDLSSALHGYLVVRWGSPAEIDHIEADRKWFWGLVCALEEIRREDECKMEDVG
jgi:hypothetical protein